jgi:predicted Zn-dependent protease
MTIQAGRFKDAVPYMRTAIKRDPNSAALWTQLAQLLMRADNLDEAVIAARKAVELAPDQVSTHMTLAELLRAQRKIPEAEAELERCIQLSLSPRSRTSLWRASTSSRRTTTRRGPPARLVEQQPRLAQARPGVAIETEN